MIKRIILSCIIAFSIFTVYSKDKYQYNEYYYQRSSLFKLLPITNNDIVFVGNSLTNNCEWYELFNSANVKNRGIISDVIQGIRDRIDPVLEGKPKKIFLMGGVNDISHKIDADSIATALQNLIFHIKEKSPTTELFLQSLLPINNDFGRYRNLKGTEQIFIDANIKLEKIAKENNITWINLFPHFTDENGKLIASLTTDGLHVNKDGYQIWGRLVEPYIGIKASSSIPEIQRDDIVLIGNSLTFGAEWSELLMSAKVKKRASSSNTSQGINNILGNVLKGSPSKIILQSSVNSYSNFSQDTILGTMQSMIERIKKSSPNTQVYIQSIIPVNTRYDAYSKSPNLNKEIKDANKRLRKMAKENGLKWIDVYSLMADKSGNLKDEYTNDGFHLMGPAYIVWRDCLKKNIK